MMYHILEVVTVAIVSYGPALLVDYIYHEEQC